MEAASPDMLTNFFNGLGNAIAEGLKGLFVLAMSSMAAAPGISSVIQLQWAKRWTRLRTSMILSVIVGAVLVLPTYLVLLLAFAALDGTLYDLNEVYEVFPFAAALSVVACLWVHNDNRATFDRVRAAGIAAGLVVVGIVVLMG